MPSKELIEKVARAIMHDEDTYRVGGEEYCETVARIAISTILAALQGPDEKILDAYWTQSGESKEMRSRVHCRADNYWRAMLDASVLGEQGE